MALRAIGRPPCVFFPVHIGPCAGEDVGYLANIVSSRGGSTPASRRSPAAQAMKHEARTHARMYVHTCTLRSELGNSSFAALQVRRRASSPCFKGHTDSCTTRRDSQPTTP